MKIEIRKNHLSLSLSSLEPISLYAIQNYDVPFFFFFIPEITRWNLFFQRQRLTRWEGMGWRREKSRRSPIFFRSFPFLPFSFLYQAQDDSIQLSRSNPGLIWHDTTALSSAQRRTIRSKLIVGPPQPAFLICGCAHDSVSASQMLSPLVSWYTDIDI